MATAWDTTVVSRLQPGSRHADVVLERAADEPVLVCAPTVMEVTRGLELRARRGDERFARLAAWFAELFDGPLVEVLAFDAVAAQVAGSVLALAPAPNAPRARGEQKADRRARWILDVQIAATAWGHGHGVGTDNQRDFLAISNAMQELYPQAPPLVVERAP